MLPLNPVLTLYTTVYLFSAAVRLAMDRLNLTRLKTTGGKVPAAFENIIDRQKLISIHRYTIDNTKFNLFRTAYNKLFFLLMVFSGVLPWMAEALARTHYLAAGLIFFAITGLFLYVLELPLDYYRHFVIEAGYDFNTKTMRTWALDIVRVLLVAAAIGTPLLASLFWLTANAGRTWWLWAWAAMIGFQCLMAMLYPTVIAPLFNTFTPLDDSELKDEIEKLASRQGVAIDGVFQMDATRRTRHTNAYFSGLGKTKRIVLYDSLIQSHSVEEILAVLAHEIGHLKKHHIKKQLALSATASLLLFYLASKLLTCRAVFAGFGFEGMPNYVGLFLAAVVWEPAGFFLMPLASYVSRKFERQADVFSTEALNTPLPLAKALKKMARDNLANLCPHPLYVWFHYSHPPLLERVGYLEDFEHSE